LDGDMVRADRHTKLLGRGGDATTVFAGTADQAARLTFPI
jgi:hypothetical protein